MSVTVTFPSSAAPIPLAGSTSITGPLGIDTGATGYAIGKASYDSLGQSAISCGSATTILDASGSGISYLIVAGDDGSGNAFADRVLVSHGIAPSKAVLESNTAAGTPAARTYSFSTTNLQLALATGLYAVRAAVITLPP